MLKKVNITTTSLWMEKSDLLQINLVSLIKNKESLIILLLMILC
jgi:hypothetical protein